MSKAKKEKSIIETLMERDADFSQLEENSQGEEGPPVPDAASLSAESTEESGDAIARLKAELAEAKDKYIRLLAEFDNYKKRVIKERSEMLKYQGEGLIFDMLEVVDNLERALQHAESDPQSLKEGVELIFKRFNEILEKWEIRGNSAIGKAFDPLVHQALSMVTQEGLESATVLDELKKPFFYKDKLLRAAQVVVAVPPETAAEEDHSADDGASEEN